MNHAKRKFKPFKKIWERETHGCLQSIGLWNVSAYLQVDSSVIELIIALGSEHTNLTCKSTFKKKEGGGLETCEKWEWNKIGLPILHTSVSRGSFVRSHMVPFVNWWAWYLHESHNENLVN